MPEVKNNILDHEEKIQYLTKVIVSICIENNLNKEVVLDDFCYELMGKSLLEIRLGE